MTPPLILASTSPYRRQLLEKLRLDFSAEVPDCDETALPGETAPQLVQRLALEKARSVARRHRQAWVIGSDQVCSIDGRILGKPGSTDAAQAQLAAASGRRVTFYTGLCLYDAASGHYQLDCDPFHVHFRPLSADTIARYVAAEQPLDCAGSFKSEGLGICLFERLEGRDPNSLVGLPLIGVVDMLHAWGLRLP